MADHSAARDKDNEPTPERPGSTHARQPERGAEPTAELGQTDPPSSRAALVLNLQRTFGNAYVQRYVSRSIREGAVGQADTLSRIEAARPSGSPLDPVTQQQLETGLGTSLSDVRVHTDTEADALAEDFHASAFTTSSDIFFRSGAYQPDTDTGRELIAHEVAHTVQQSSGLAGGAPGSDGLTVSHPTDPSELAAEEIAQRLTGAQSVPAATPGPPPIAPGSANVQRAPDGRTDDAQEAPGSTAPAPPAAERPASAAGPPAASSANAQPVGSATPRTAAPPASSAAGAASPPPAAQAPPAPAPAPTPAPPAPPVMAASTLNPPSAPPPQVAAPRTDLSQVNGAASQAQSTLASLLTPGQAAEALTPGAQLLVSALQQAGERGADQIVSAANQAIAAIQAGTAEQSSAIEQAEVEQTEVLHADFEQGQTQIQDAVTGQSEKLQTSATGEQARILDWSKQATTQAEQEVGTRQQQLETAGDAQADQARAAGARATSNASSALSSAGSQAQQSASSGGGESNEAEQQGHAEVANRLSSETADQIDSATNQVEDQFGTHAAEAATEVESHAERMATAVGSHLPTLQASIGETASGTAEQLAASASSAASTLNEHGQQAVEQLGTTASRLTGELGGEAQDSRDQLHEGAGQAIEAISTQAAQAVTDARAVLADQVAQVQTAAIDEQSAADGAAQAQTQVEGAFSAAAGEIDEVQGGITDQLASIGGSAVSALVDVPARVRGQLTPATAGLTGELADATTQLTSSMAQGVDATSAAAGAAIATTTAALDELVASGRDALSGAVAEVGAGLDRGASETQTRAVDAASGLQQRIQAGNQRVDASVQTEGQADVQRSILGDIADWVGDQLKSLWTLLKDPAFWIGLGVTLILFPFLGPGALVVGGMVGGAVGGIEQNIKQGKKWYDPHNIIVGAAIGAAAGAAFAFGGGFIVGLGLEGAAAVGATMALGAGVGIVINLATGQRWDKGLLANLFLGWLFHKVGAAAGKGEAVPEAGPEPGPGGEPNPESQGPEPNTPKPAEELPAADETGTESPGKNPADCFVAGTPVDTPEGSVAIEELMAGATVFGWDLASSSRVSALVTVVTRREVAAVLDIRVAGTVITCSPEHPFWVPGNGWQIAGTLTAGATLLTRDGQPVTVDTVEQRKGQFAVYNMTVDRRHNYFVGPAGILVHNKAMRWALADRVAGLEERAAAANARIEALPAEAPGRPQLMEQARGMQSEATALGERARAAPDEAALEPERPAIESLEERLNHVEEGLEVIETPLKVPKLQSDIDSLLKRAEEHLPPELPERWGIIGKIRLLKQEGADLRELVNAGLADESVVHEYDRIRGELRDLESEVVPHEPAPAVVDAWQQRLNGAEWSPHGFKHMKARTAAEAREMSTPTDNEPGPPSQYLPEVDNQALELEALRNGEVIRGDPSQPGGGVHVKYDAHRPVGYDGGELVWTIRAEIAGNTYHGHPRKF